ncbi:MAG: hypothetical protein HWN67_20760 [Candidatus Helarchaeota archaeon]|nr:hypothetical protein [Candidatus Helarchaeota archaeon]
MKKISKVLIIFLLLIGYVSIGIYGYQAYQKNRQKEQMKLNMVLLSLIPAEFTIEIEAIGDCYASYIIGSDSQSPLIYTNINYTFKGSGSHAYVNGFPRWDGNILTIRLRMNGKIVSEKTSNLASEKIEFEAYSPFNNFLFLAFLI